MNRRKLGPLTGYLSAAATGSERITVCVAHGFGADASDLLSLEHTIAGDRRRWLFPEAPLSLPGGGRSWFQVGSMAAWLSSREDPVGAAMNVSSHELVESGRQLAAAAESVSDPAHLVLGGFSQGGMVALHAYHALCEQGRRPLAYLGLATAPLGLDALSGTATLGQKMRFFLAHGSSDAVLPEKMAAAFFQALRRRGADGSYWRHPGGHTIPVPVITRLDRWLATLEADAFD